MQSSMISAIGNRDVNGIATLYFDRIVCYFLSGKQMLLTIQIAQKKSILVMRLYVIFFYLNKLIFLFIQKIF